MEFLVILSAVTLLVALIIINSAIKATEGKVAINFRAMVIHFIAFAILAVQILILQISFFVLEK